LGKLNLLQAFRGMMKKNEAGGNKSMDMRSPCKKAWAVSIINAAYGDFEQI
jgi:hypothetical protein